jgi:hypothetical protein
MSTEPRASAKAEKTQKPYQTPRLVEYGDIRAVTQTLSPSGTKNDGGSGKTKTA